MNTAVDIPTTASAGLSGVVDCAHQIVELASRVDVPESGLPGSFADAVTAVQAAVTAVQGLQLRLVAAADAAGVRQQDGHASTGAWLAAQTQTTSADAARTVRLGARLAGLPEVADAVRTGRVGIGQARVIADTITRIDGRPADERIDDLDRALIITTLTARAAEMSVSELRADADRVLEILDRDQTQVDADQDQTVAAREQAALDKSRLTLHDNGDGTITGRFIVPCFAGKVLRTLVQQIASPRRHALRRDDELASAAQTGQPAQPGDRWDAGVDWPHEYGLALVEILEHLPTDRLTGPAAATIVVTMDLDTLTNGVQAAGLGTTRNNSTTQNSGDRVCESSLGETLSAAAVRRLACQAGLIPAVLGSGSVPVDLGRKTRLFSETQRAAFATRHATCAAAGCDRPYAWCELHHRQPWTTGGRTDLDNAIPLCGTHHRMIHDQNYRHAIHDRPDQTPRALFRQRT